MKKKILFVIESFAIGGAEKSLINLLNTLDFSAYDVTVVIFAKGGALEPQLPAFIHLVHLPHQFSRLKRLKFFLCRKALRPQQTEDLFWKIFSKDVPDFPGNWDVAVAYGQGFPTYFVAEKVKADKKIAWVNTDFIKAGYNAHFDAPFYQKMHTVVNVSEAGKNSFESAFNDTPLGNVVVIEDLINHQYVLKQAAETVDFAESARLKLVSVGRLHPAKGYGLAIDAAEILRDKKLDFEWHIIGEGSERQTLEELIRKQNLSDYVILEGADNNPYKYMAAADIYVQTSLYEGFSITVREAKALGKIVVSTNFPSVFSAITDGQNGIIAEMNAENIAEKIMNTAANVNLKNKIIDNLSKENQTGESDKISTLSKLLLNYDGLSL